jgi:RPA family protein
MGVTLDFSPQKEYRLSPLKNKVMRIFIYGTLSVIVKDEMGLVTTL